MSKRKFALDLGTWAIRIGSLSERRDGSVIDMLHETRYDPLDDMPLKGVFAQFEVNRDSLQKYTRQILQTAGIKTIEAPVSLPDQFFSVKYLDIPRAYVSDEQSREYLGWRIRELLPSTLASESVMDFQLLGPSLERDGESLNRVMVVLMKEQLVNDLAATMFSAGLNISYLTMNSQDCHNFLDNVNYSPDHEAEDSVVDEFCDCLLHTGNFGCHLTFISGGVPLYSRLFDRAGFHFTQNLSSVRSIDLCDAGKLKHSDVFISEKIHDYQNSNFDFVDFQHVFAEYLREIDMTFRSFRGKFPDREIRRVIMSGGSSALKGMKDFLGRMLRIPCTIISSPDHIRLELKESLQGGDYSILPFASLCGLLTGRVNQQ
ncbi:MAG: hypothetical protein CVV64_04035 [Candidatus Wallbacteria bacterium HGW-Wallbacteria-1]|jgi:Tfp pilus assembly PilM family ATPase|uniref:SHS2 domain-containing protein n=1 Tax=Candidatus Wallbacteria bacterium HGW-Wallbacteria-1 TaxID=2013854 RepID=A0A2N1PRJ4_9BACT|nr:MAG: hypothetical protein CVV64_04035 [Candidatus Wallbacteria bacterium HGW-Wallbacteria-1]